MKLPPTAGDSGKPVAPARMETPFLRQAGAALVLRTDGWEYVAAPKSGASL